MNFIGNACLTQTSDCLEREQVFLGWGTVKSAKIRGIPGFLLKMLNLMKFSKFLLKSPPRHLKNIVNS